MFAAAQTRRHGYARLATCPRHVAVAGAEDHHAEHLGASASVRTGAANRAGRPARSRRAWGHHVSAAVAVECALCVSRFDERLREVAVAAGPPHDILRGETSTAAGIDGAIALWRAADVDLSPIVGRRGALAVLRRALALNRPAFEWLPALEDVLDSEDGIARLQAAVAGRPPDEADAAASALSATLHDLLASLVGAALARQLLRTVRDRRSHGTTAR